jgi:predicted nucleic acid-binding protein
LTLVLDASIVTAALTDPESQGDWAREMLRTPDINVPHHLHVEVANSLRRAALRGLIPWHEVDVAYADLLELTFELFAYEPLALRVWELRQNVTPYDGWYIALAEALDAPLATLDRRLAAAPGPRCEFVLPPA